MRKFSVSAPIRGETIGAGSKSRPRSSEATSASSGTRRWREGAPCSATTWTSRSTSKRSARLLPKKGRRHPRRTDWGNWLDGKGGRLLLPPFVFSGKKRRVIDERAGQEPGQ